MSGYLDFKSTGEREVDRLLGAIEDAGHRYHHTEMWIEEGYGGGPSCVESIDAAAARLAAAFTELRAERDEAARLLRQVHRTFGSDWLYSECPEADWVAARDALLARIGGGESDA